MRYKKKRSKPIKILIIILTIIIITFLGIWMMLEIQLSEIVNDMAVNTVKAKAAIIISSAIYEEIEDQDITYERLVSFEKDEAGKITALKTNIIEMNKLKSGLSVKILKELEEMNSTDIIVPLGTIIGGDLIGGKGPDIVVEVIPVGSIETEITNEISSAGINQSRHQIMMKVHADLTIITSLGKLTTDIETYICIAETVIVGDVPGTYTNINRIS